MMMRALSVGKGGRLLQEGSPKAIAKLMASKAQVTWVDLQDPSADDIRLLETLFCFHPLTVEDVLHGSQRPKIENFGNYAFIVVRGLDENGAGSEQLNIYLGPNYVVTVDVHNIKTVDDAFSRMARNPAALSRGADFVAYTILDNIVDGFFPVIDKLDDEIDLVEDRIFQSGDSKVLVELFDLKRRVVAVRRVAMPMREIANALARRDFEFITPRNSVYFRDVYDHLVRITEATDNMRDLITSSMEGYLSVISNSLNVVMKKLASITVIIMLPTLIAGIYGMNVSGLPLSNMPYSFEILVAAMAALGLGSYAWLHRIGWI